MKRYFIYTLLIGALFTLGSWTSGFKPVFDLGSLTIEEMSSGLKDALQKGVGTAVNVLHQNGGYLNNSRFKIPFPQDAQMAADKLRRLGFGSQVDKFVETMNHAAEDAAIEAQPIFVNAIKQMGITDAKNILLGQDDAATVYFKGKTYDALFAAFAPKIKTALEKTQATKYWSTITTKYNKLPMVKPVQTDLVKYTTDKALAGLFLKMADEEKNIRANLASRTTPTMQKVFDWVAKQKKRP